MKHGYCTYGYGMVPIEESLPHIAELGFQGIELCTLPGYSTNLELLYRGKIRELKTLLESSGLELAALGAHTGCLEADPQQRALSIARLKRNIDLAMELGAPVVNTLSGQAPTNWPEEQAWETLVEGVEDYVSYAEDRSIVIGFEPHVAMLIDSAPKMLRLLELMPSPSLRVNLDTSHFAVLGYDIPQAVRQLAPYATYAHVKDMVGLYPDFEFLTPGEGDFDFVALVQALRDNGYQGYISPEISVMRRRKLDYDPFKAAELAYRTISRALVEATL
jgi:sugar phosphate isomerase/epimerase